MVSLSSTWDPAACTALLISKLFYKDVGWCLLPHELHVEDGSRALKQHTRPETMFGDTAVAKNPND